MGKEGYAAAQNNWKWNSEFYKKEELRENSIYLSNRPHFLWVYRRDNPGGMLGEHEKNL